MASDFEISDSDSDSSLGIGEYDAVADRQLVNAIFDSDSDEEGFAGFNAIWVESRTLGRPVLRDAGDAWARRTRAPWARRTRASWARSRRTRPWCVRPWA